jgi:hypothetical protein
MKNEYRYSKLKIIKPVTVTEIEKLFLVSNPALC